MDLGSPPATQFQPPGNAIIHANVHSIEREPEVGVSQSSSFHDEVAKQLSPEEIEEQKRASDMQLWWDEAISRNMNIPDGYRDVAVLIIKWDDDIDQLKCAPEVKELKALFEDMFRYTTEVLELNISKKPQHQLNSALLNFVKEHDGPNKLMIVYYTGHGTFREHEKILELSATNDAQALRRYMIQPRANFNSAEEYLRSSDIDADVLTILDTCFSSNIQKSGLEDDRTYELLSACGLDMTTSSPGPNSFTRALIDSLKELLDECGDGSFTTFNLQQKINLHQARRDTPAFLWNRLQHHERHIRLSRLREDRTRFTKTLLCHPINAYLNLRLALKDATLSQAQIEALTKDLASIFNRRGKLAVRRIDWMGIRRPARTEGFRRGALALHFFVKWRKLVARKRKRAREDAGSARHSPDPPPRKKSCRKKAVQQQLARDVQAGRGDHVDEALGTQDMVAETGFAPLTPASEEVVDV